MMKLLHVLAILSVGASASLQGRPNILFILADDLGWRDCGCYGSDYYETPSIDQLAKTGIRFRQAYAASPLCSPTRASILTGQYPGRLRLTMPAGHLPKVVLDPKLRDRGPSYQRALVAETRTRLPNEALTIGEEARAAGYATAFMGKWHLGTDPYLPENQGFDVVVGGRQHPGPPQPGYFGPWPGVSTLPDVPAGTHIDDVLGDEAIAFLKQPRDKPFFLNLWFYGVHAPFEAKKELIEKYTAKTTPQSANCPTMGAMIETMDRNIGRVLDTLAKLDLHENTIVIFTSDNGGNMYNEVDGKSPTDNAPLRAGKGNAYEGGCRVPLIVSWPGTVKSDSVSDAITSSVDWFPTMLEIIGRETPPDLPLDGVSLLPALRAQPLERDSIYCHFPHYVKATGNFPVTWVRQGDWKLLRFFADNPDQTDRLELYNLADDIGEQRNLVTTEAARTSFLNDLISTHLEETEALVPVPNPTYRGTIQVANWWGNNHATLTVRNSMLVVTSSGRAPFLATNDLPVANGPLTLDLRLSSNSQGKAIVYWSESGEEFHLSRSKSISIKHDATFRNYSVKLASSGSITSLRLDPGRAPGEIVIEWMRLRDAEGTIIKDWIFQN